MPVTVLGALYTTPPQPFQRGVYTEKAFWGLQTCPRYIADRGDSGIRYVFLAVLLSPLTLTLNDESLDDVNVLLNNAFTLV